MSFSKDFSRGMRGFREAHKIIFKHKLAKFLVIPGIATLLYTTLFFIGAIHFAKRIDADAAAYPSWLSWMGDFTYWFLETVYWVAAIFLFMASLKYVLQVILSPFLSQISESVEKMAWGNEPDPFTFKAFFHDFVRSLKLAIRNSVIELFLCLVLGFIPGVGQVAGFMVSSYFCGFGYIDYVLESKKMSVAESVAFVRAHRGFAMGIGLVNNLLMLIPVLGWVIAPTYATVAVTIETLRLLDPNDESRLDAFSK